jgi:hypothetical protein
MTNMMQVQGTLISGNSKMVTAEMTDILRAAFDSHGFPDTIPSVATSSVGTVPIDLSIERIKEDNLPANVTESGLQWEAMFSFTDALEDALSSETIQKLRLKGSVLVTVGSDTKPLYFLLTVENNSVWYQEASVTVTQ